MFKIKDYNVTIFGDSIAKGVITTSDGKIARLKDSAVNILQEHWNKEINNNSSFGQTLKKLYDKKYIDEYVSSLDNSRENCVILAIGGNDSNFNWKEVAENPSKFHNSNTPVNQFKKYLDKLVKKLKKANVKVVLTTLVPMDSKKFFDNVIGKQADKKSVMVFLKNDLSNIYKYQERFSLEIMHCAMTNECDLIDLRSQLLCRRNYSTLLCKDGIHPNQQGQKAIAKIFKKSFC